MKIFFDKKGREIKEFDLLKVFHFIGARRKKHYMYKWVRIKTIADKKFFMGMHLMKTGGEFYLGAVADKDNKLPNAEIVQRGFYDESF